MENKEILIYSTGGVAAATHEACRLYESLRPGITVRNYNGKESELIPLVEETRRGDLISIGAEFPIDLMQARGLVDPAHRYHIGWRDVVLLVKAGNPKGIAGAADLARPEVRVAANWDGCLAGTWESVALAGAPDLVDTIRARIVIWGDGCGRLVRHLLEDDADVILGWSSFPSFKEKAIEMVRLPAAQRIHRSTSVALLTCAKEKEAALDLCRFLASPESRAIYARLGWEIPRPR